MDSNKKSGKPGKKKAFFTTIVGGRPPDSGTNVGDIPRGIEVLVMKASVDPVFRMLLLQKRAEAARQIDLELTEAERNMLSSISSEQLEKIIENTKVKPEHRSIFQGTTAKLMLAVAAGIVIAPFLYTSLGHTLTKEQIEHLQQMRIERMKDINDVNDPNETELNPEEFEQTPANETDESDDKDLEQNG